MLNKILPDFLIEILLIIDINIEFEFNIMIQAHKNHIIKYYSNSDFNIFDHLESFEYFIEYIHKYIFRRK